MKTENNVLRPLIFELRNALLDVNMKASDKYDLGQRVDLQLRKLRLSKKTGELK